MVGPSEEDEEGPYACTPPNGPSIREQRRQAAERGDVEFFLGVIRTKPWSLFSIDELLKLLMRACEVRAKSDPAGYSRELFALMIGFNSFLLMRTQIYITDRIAGRGESPCTPSLADFSNDLVERLLPRLLDLQRGVCEILAAQAQTARIWSLQQAKEAKHATAVVTNPSGTRRTRGSGPKMTRSRPSRVDGETDGSSNGVVPLHAGGRRRG